MEIEPNEAKTDERLPWHKPEVKCLVVNLDTKGTAGSGGDGGTFEFID